MKVSGSYERQNECNYSVQMDGSAQHVLRKVNCLNLISELAFHPLCTKVCKNLMVFFAKIPCCHFGGCKLFNLSLEFPIVSIAEHSVNN